MAYRSKLVTLVLALLLAPSAFAGYQTMRAPPGWNPGGQPSYKPTKGEFYDLDKKTWMTLGSANIGGRELTVPVAMPLSTGLSVGLAVATAFSSNPAILLGTIAWGLYQTYLSQKRITPNEDGTFTKVSDGTECLSGCFEYAVPASVPQWAKTPEDACSAGAAYITAAGQLTRGSFVSGVCRYEYWRGSYWDLPQNKSMASREIPPWSTATTRLAPPSEVASDMQNIPMPKPLVEALPMPLPVGQPRINPGSDGLPQVMRLPQGSPFPIPLPSPNPDNLPQQWKTPVIDLIPSPTPYDPWRVEVIPKDIIKTSPTPLPDPLNPDPTVIPTPTPVNDPDATESPSDKTPGLCDLYPDILACAKPNLGSVEPSVIPNENKSLAIIPDSGWGPSSGSCPAPKTVTVMGVALSMPYTMLCDFASAIKPLLIAFAWLSAAMSFFGMARKD